ncbi:hypothetical protein ACJJIW_14680 [Microbulbifer sp. JMSA004]|uniref:hypothetical protein n=1 Tax=Microbulbifer sp. JMSA004 TaxID=3243370 RepID=UPI0040397817
MKKLIFFLLFSSCANGTAIEPATLGQFLESTDHVPHALVQKVDMITSSGEITFNPDGRTSPLSGNKIRLHVKLMPNGVIKNNLDHIPPGILRRILGDVALSTRQYPRVIIRRRIYFSAERSKLKQGIPPVFHEKNR